MRKGALKRTAGASGGSGGFQGGLAEPGCQTSPKECIKIVEKEEEKKPQKTTAGASGASEGFQGGRAEPGCQTSPKECIKIVEQ